MNIDLPSKIVKDAIGNTASRRKTLTPSQFKTAATPKMPSALSPSDINEP